jgi:hypothetical protein
MCVHGYFGEKTVEEMLEKVQTSPDTKKYLPIYKAAAELAKVQIE